MRASQLAIYTSAKVLYSQLDLKDPVVNIYRITYFLPKHFQYKNFLFTP